MAKRVLSFAHEPEKGCFGCPLRNSTVHACKLTDDVYLQTPAKRLPLKGKAAPEWCPFWQMAPRVRNSRKKAA